MPGMLSSIFDGGGGGTVQSGEAQSYDATIEGGQDVDLNLDLGLEVGGTYTNPDGSTTTWSNTQDVGLHTDVDATFQAILSTDAARNDVQADG